MKTRTIIILFFAAICLLVASLSYLSYLQLGRISRPLGTEVPQSIEQLARTSHVDGLAQLLQYYDEATVQSLRNYAYTSDRLWLDRYWAARAQMEFTLSQLVNESAPADRGYFQQMANAEGGRAALETQAAKEVEGGQSGAAQAILDGSEYSGKNQDFLNALQDYFSQRGIGLDSAAEASTYTVQLAAQDVQDRLNRAVALTTTTLLGTLGGLLLLLVLLLRAIEDKEGVHFQLEEAQQLAHLGNWEWDIAHDRISWSDELGRLFGLPGGRGFDETYPALMEKVHPDDRAQYERLLKDAMSGKPQDWEHRLLRPDGSVAWIHARTKTVLDAGGKPLILRGTAQDITDRKKAQEAMHEMEERRKVDAAKALFLSVVSHELRSPMTPIKAQAQMLSRGYFGALNERQRAALGVVLRNTDRLDMVMEDFLDVMRIDTARLKFNFVRTRLEPHLRRLVSEMGEVLPEKHIEIVAKIHPLPVVEIDPARTSQVLRNLLTNAKKFSPSNTKVVLEVTAQKKGLLFSVADRGIGIKEEDKPKLFTPFFQLEQTMYRTYGGTGLGLVICKGIVQAQGGKIWVESKLGEGSTFYFTLPYKPLRKVKRIRILFKPAAI
ncbi:MAG: PAS domain-containing protein [Candidatus Micrarchaeota archaeon]|nr:PAS domain-containing protein [Candidatus Micrarchaeota archaeon]